MKASFSRRASVSRMPDWTWIPASRNKASPDPLTSGFGSCIAVTTRATPASNEGLCTRRCSALVGARFERCVHSRAASGLAGLLQCNRLCVMDAVIRVETLADDRAILYDDGSDHRAWTGKSCADFGEFESFPNVFFVVHKFGSSSFGVPSILMPRRATPRNHRRKTR